MPAYDTQKDIYLGLVAELKEAIALIDASSGSIDGDIIFNGNMMMWRKFASSLQLRLGMRASEVDPAWAKQVIVDVLNSGNDFFQPGEAALFQYLGGDPNWNQFYEDRFELKRKDYGCSKLLIDTLMSRNDPRLAQYANPNQFGNYVGQPYGILGGDCFPVPDISEPHTDNCRSETTPAILMTHAEVAFIRAEAAARGWTGEDAAALYKEAILSSMSYWGVNSGDAANYVAQADVTFDAAKWREQIGYQKWLALYMQGIEGWSEWRRLDYPTLYPAPEALSGRVIPRRRNYPQREFELNEDNYNAAVGAQGPDEPNTRVWWDQL